MSDAPTPADEGTEDHSTPQVTDTAGEQPLVGNPPFGDTDPNVGQEQVQARVDAEGETGIGGVAPAEPAPGGEGTPQSGSPADVQASGGTTGTTTPPGTSETTAAPEAQAPAAESSELTEEEQAKVQSLVASGISHDDATAQVLAERTTT